MPKQTLHECSKFENLAVACFAESCDQHGICPPVESSEVPKDFALICEKLCGQPVLCEFFDGCIHYQDWKLMRSLKIC